jgi:sugar phosphate isomerase/epimerase
MDERVSLNLVSFPDSSLSDDLELCRRNGIARIVLPRSKLTERTHDVRAVIDSGLKVASLLHGVPFDLEKSQAWQQDRAALFESIELARAVETSSIYLVSGPAGHLTWDAAIAAFAEAIGPVVPEADRHGISLLLEPTNLLYTDVSFVHSLTDAVEVADEIGMGICLDLFWVWPDAQRSDQLAGVIGRTGLVQVSDYVPGPPRVLPNRAVPGDGIMPLRKMIDDIVKFGYQGSFDLELIGPRIDAEGPEAAARRSATVLTQWLQDQQSS